MERSAQAEKTPQDRGMMYGSNPSTTVKDIDVLNPSKHDQVAPDALSSTYNAMTSGSNMNMSQTREISLLHQGPFQSQLPSQSLSREDPRYMMQSQQYTAAQSYHSGMPTNQAFMQGSFGYYYGNYGQQPSMMNVGPHQQMHYNAARYPYQYPNMAFNNSIVSPRPYYTSSNQEHGNNNPGLYYPVVADQAFAPNQRGVYNAQRQQATDRNILAQQQSISYPRGPPRKPKQSGHALWVGNLPPHTSIIDLKDHFSRDAIHDIESAFLISKSNCAFVNYRSAESCEAAMVRFHDSRFHGTRIVCRLRQAAGASASDSNSNIETASKEGNEVDHISTTLDEMKLSKNDDSVDGTTAGSSADDQSCQGQDAAEVVPERFFIVKSLTHQDLEASVRNAIWATQSHNEEALNKAFASAHAVYLIFSANKSGEYFGYARMLSRITSDTVTSNPNAQTPQVTTSFPLPSSTSDGPTASYTAATESAPPGRVIDDSARGTIFWESLFHQQQQPTSADQSTTMQTDETTDSQVIEVESKEKRQDSMLETTQQDWGKPFRIEWMCTTKLPFFRTRGLRNPWNSNREVKIARDGTELEPGVGRKLLELFHATASVPMIIPIGQIQQGQGMGYM